MTLEETLEKIHPADKTAMEAALAHWNNIAMPLHSLGRLQDTVVSPVLQGMPEWT